MFKKVIFLLAILALVAAACGDDDDPGATPTTPAPPPTAGPVTTPSPAPMDSPSVQVTASGLGDILTDGEGNTLYLFVPDDAGTSVCNGPCSSVWPPLEGEPTAGDGADAALLGTAARDDGTTQATYNGWPLYNFSGDTAPGDSNGQGLNNIWWVISPTGDAIM